MVEKCVLCPRLSFLVGLPLAASLLTTAPTVAGDRSVIPVPASLVSRARAVPPAEMQRLYDEVNTPHKYGVILRPEGTSVSDTRPMVRMGVSVIGEIRTRETMEHAIVFAETGHLCMATLHSNNANQALDRIINFFPEDRRNQLLLDLSLNLKAIIGQQLIPRCDGKERMVPLSLPARQALAAVDARVEARRPDPVLEVPGLATEEQQVVLVLVGELGDLLHQRSEAVDGDGGSLGGLDAAAAEAVDAARRDVARALEGRKRGALALEHLVRWPERGQVNRHVLAELLAHIVKLFRQGLGVVIEPGDHERGQLEPDAEARRPTAVLPDDVVVELAVDPHRLAERVLVSADRRDLTSDVEVEQLQAVEQRGASTTPVARALVAAAIGGVAGHQDQREEAEHDGVHGIEDVREDDLTRAATGTRRCRVHQSGSDARLDLRRGGL